MFRRLYIIIINCIGLGVKIVVEHGLVYGFWKKDSKALKGLNINIVEIRVDFDSKPSLFNKFKLIIVCQFSFLFLVVVKISELRV